MNHCVIDASVAVKWYVPEEHSIEAARLLRDDHVLVAPDLIYAEIANTLWKKVRREEIRARDASEILDAFIASPVEIYPSSTLLPAAFDLAVGLGRSVYDSLYLALAVERFAHVVTADEKFANAVKATAFADNVQWIGDAAN